MFTTNKSIYFLIEQSSHLYRLVMKITSMIAHFYWTTYALVLIKFKYIELYILNYLHPCTYACANRCYLLFGYLVIAGVYPLPGPPEAPHSGAQIFYTDIEYVNKPWYAGGGYYLTAQPVCKFKTGIYQEVPYNSAYLYIALYDDTSYGHIQVSLTHNYLVF